MWRRLVVVGGAIGALFSVWVLFMIFMVGPELRDPPYTEVWIDCPDATAWVWVDTDALPLSSADEARFCENIGNLAKP